MNDGLKEMGERFRAKREEMSLSLKEVENAISIRMLYLQAIEDGKVSHFLSNVYALGFMRQYATFLGFDHDQLLKEHPEVFRMPVEKQDFAYGIGTLESRSSPQGSIRWLPNLFRSLFLVLLVITGYYLARFFGLF